VLIASLAERRKAERLLAYAKVDFSWANAPGAKEIRAQGERRLEEALRADAAAEPSAAALAMVQRLSPDIKQDRLLLLLLDRELERLPKGEVLRPVDTRVTKSTDSYRRDSGPPVSHADFSRDAVVFRVNLGAESRAEPGWLLPLICRRGGVTRREVGAIRVGPQSSEFEIAGEAAKDFALAASQSDPRAPHVHIEVAGRTIGRPPAHEVDAKTDRHRGQMPLAKPSPRPHAAAPPVRFGGSHPGKPSGGFSKGPSFSRPGRPAPIPVAKHKWHPKPGKRSQPR
jgi:ATP-dependent RNA helicase DeaD